MSAAADAPALVLRWLVPLRFVAAAGQALALVVARGALGLPLPYATLALVPALTLATNLALAWPALRGALPARALVPALLLLDSLLFTFLLRWSGGPDNPFSALYAIHVAMAAMTGSAATTWAVALASALGYACSATRSSSAGTSPSTSGTPPWRRASTWACTRWGCGWPWRWWPWSSPTSSGA